MRFQHCADVDCPSTIASGVCDVHHVLSADDNEVLANPVLVFQDCIESFLELFELGLNNVRTVWCATV